MRTPVKLGGYVAAVAAAAGLAFGVGTAVGPIAVDTPTHHSSGEDMTNPHAHRGAEEHAAPGGLQVSEAGYTLDLESRILDAGTSEVAFRVTGPDGAAVTAFDRSHEKELHFIAVRRDTTQFQHVHPVMDDSGTWRADVDLTPGDWRFFADFQPEGEDAMTLGVDAAVAGDYVPDPLTGETRVAHVDGYDVALGGELVPGESREITLTVTKNGEPVADLQPYLGAYGHLVALRVGDLGYLHVHPEGEPSDDTGGGPEISFAATAPSAGAYRLFLDFQHDGVVRTADFTLDATAGGQESADHGEHG
ncbi:hypothetical protein DW322_16680 [Rhodococcus rhodnii]|uniref:Secreted protein n=2 Tax=Rhodococcus rhodnii TaxID=38312 RepID=R7WM97_9NOCA|nr:hypothetical protein [Rhodococcus rhodnii]EOM76418.1 hypothetical protein Rrhod_2211 [Rhodococcus rhodnii LMG 5362]TXG91536.1 hypothetical protein DW322_16680 [Rhodococcus rhodnii]